MKSKALFLTPYPHGTAGSQRFRFEQYYDFLKEKGLEIRYQSFIDESTWSILYKKGFILKKIIGLLKGLVLRKLTVLTAWRYDYVFIHREAAPLGPPIFEWYLAKILRKKIIYDFDDAIWKENTTATNGFISKIKWASKVGSICKWSHKVSCGNQFLADYASRFNSKVVINPTTIDTENLHIPKSYNNDKLVIGWTGTHSTLKYLNIISEPLRKLSEKHEFDFLVIADKEPDIDIPNLKYIPWSKETEVADLNQIDIGVMPLEDDEWARGKCGFKALQFMALETPVLVSPVGVNAEIVTEGIHGFHCQSPEEWAIKLEQLLQDSSIRKKMGVEERKKVVKEFSVISNEVNFSSLFN